MKNIRKQPLKEKGITLVALVVTIIVLLILAGISLGMATGNNGIIQRAKDAKATHEEGEANDTKTIAGMSDYMNEKLGKTGLSEDKVALVNNKIREATTLQQLQVAYEAKKMEAGEGELYDATKGRGITVEGAYSGTGSDQVFYQSEIGAIGTNKLKWYILSADEKGVNLVSERTMKQVTFKDSPGYDNCLYYLNELSTKLFANEDLGIKESRIHALRLTDIKKAAEQANEGTDWNWETDVMSKLEKGTGAKLGTAIIITDTSKTYHPAIYQVKEGTTKVEANNDMYDEIPGSKILDSGINRQEVGNPASKLTINSTFGYDTSEESWKGKLGRFGNSKVAEELFKSNGTQCYIASRYVSASGTAGFGLRMIHLGRLYDVAQSMCYSAGENNKQNGTFRVVISVPGNRVNIADDGTVTIKQANP